MRVPMRRQPPPPNLLEQLLGRDRVTYLRRRAGLAALGAGWTLLKPRPRRWRIGASTLATVASMTALAAVLVVR